MTVKPTPAQTANESAKRLSSFVLLAVGKALRIVRSGLTGAIDLLSRAITRVDFVREGQLRFQVRPDDIFLVTYPRSGTTLLQMILYQLTTDGSMELEHIAQYCPWFEHLIRIGGDLEEIPSPRIFKSHLPYGWIPKGPCRYIYVVRDGRDVAVSYYYFYRAMDGFRGTFDGFFEQFMRGKANYGSWFDHVAGWWKNKGNLNVLWLRYEDLVQDLEGCIRRIAAFCGLEIDEERLPTIVKRCGFSFMKAHQSKFDPQEQFKWEQGAAGIDFIRKGEAGQWREYFSRANQDLYDEAFQTRLGGTGLVFDSEQALVAGSKAERAQPEEGSSQSGSERT